MRYVFSTQNSDTREFMDDKQINDSLNSRGFLSPALGYVKARYRQQFGQAFSDVEDLSDLAQGLLIAAGVKRNEIHMIASIVFFQRAVRSCQTAILLCEAGLVVEAQTLLRTAVEVIFYGGALATDASVFQLIARAGDISDRKQAEAIINSRTCLELTDEQVEQLGYVIQKGGGKEGGLSAIEAARVAGLMELYDTVYRGFSSTASHATFRSLDSSLEVTENSVRLLTGPTTHNLSSL